MPLGIAPSRTTEENGAMPSGIAPCGLLQRQRDDDFEAANMTVALVRQAIRAFLRTPTPQVLCIRGKWGVGKTFIWNECLKQTTEEGGVSLPYYSYVSLFGLQSLDEIRQSIFENSVPTKKGEIRPSFDSLGENIKRYTLAASRKLSKFAPHAKLPYLDKYVANLSGGFRQIVSLVVRETIICFDDFERGKICAKELLGLVSLFREQKECKAVIILNEDALGDTEKKEFRRYFDKVVDVPIEFAPTPNECAEIAIKDTDFASRRIKENVVKLGISNIRIIYRIKTVAQDLMRVLGEFDDEIKKQALHTLTLLIWSKYDDGAIPMDNIVHHEGRMLRLMGKDERSEDDRSWDDKLDEYGFRDCDELDAAIIAGVDRGFFDEAEIVNQAQQQHARQDAAAAQEGLLQAWRPFHDTFDSTGVPHVVDGICAAYRLYMKYVSRGNLDDVLEILRALDFADNASELIARYVDTHREHIRAIDEHADPFHSVIKDDEFRAALAAAAVPPPPKPIKGILTDLYHGKLNQEDIDAACALSADDLHAIFSGLRGEELCPVVEGSLFFRRMANATDPQKALTKHALEALERIGRESAINAIRVKKFGVQIAEAKPPDGESPVAPEC
jgi:hypothetical protein